MTPTITRLFQLLTSGPLILACLTIAAVMLSVPGGPAPLLATVFLVPLAIACSRLKPLLAFLLATASCWLFWLYAVWWLLPALIAFADVNTMLAFALLALVTLSCALPCGVFFGVMQLDGSLQKPWPALRAALLYAIIMSWLPSLIPGNPLHFLFRYPILLQFADLGGMPLLYFLHGFFQFSLVTLLIRLQTRHTGIVRSLTTLLVTVLVILAYGQWRIVDWGSRPGSNLTIASVQPMLSRQDNTDSLFSLSTALAQAKPDLIAWPEIPPAFSISDDNQQRTRVESLVDASNTPYLLNSGYVYRRDEQGKRLPGYYNASHLLQPHRRQDYYKQILVPFFEYLPFSHQLPGLRKLFPGTLNYYPGDEASILILNEQVRIIPIICYESIFSDAVGDFVDAGGNVIVNPVSDTWFGESRGSALHLALGLVRAIEYRIPFVRVANSGISAAISATGEIIPGSETRLNTQAHRINQVRITQNPSPYSITGDLFLWLASLATALTLGVRWRRATAQRPAD